jgi:uncharacterized membrane protein (DUF373 family)
MNEPRPLAKTSIVVLDVIQKVLVTVMIVLLVAVLIVAVVELWGLFLTGARSKLSAVANSADFQDILQNAFGGILVIFVGLELLETMRAYFADHHVRVEVILFVAIIATGRHIIGLDVHHTEPLTFVGLAALMLALSGSYFLLKRTGAAQTKG